MLPLGKRDGPKDSVHPVQIAEPSPSDPTEFPGEEEVMRIKTCFVWSGLTCPGVLLHPCAACRSTLLGKSIHSQAGHPQAGASNPLPPKIWAQERLGMQLSIQVLAIVSYSICMRMRVGVFGGRERARERETENERTRERTRDGPSLISGSIQLIHFNASYSLSMDLGAPCHTEMWSSQRGIAQCSSCPSHSRDQESL